MTQLASVKVSISYGFFSTTRVNFESKV